MASLPRVCEERHVLFKELTEYLDSSRVTYEIKQHPAAFSAQEVAEKAHISGHRVAKTVAVRLDGELGLCILPATELINFNILSLVAGCKAAELASEEDIKACCFQYQQDSLSAFGNLYGLSVFLSESLKGYRSLAFSSGVASQLIVLSWYDFNKLVHPVILGNDLREAIG